MLDFKNTIPPYDGDTNGSTLAANDFQGGEQFHATILNATEGFQGGTGNNTLTSPTFVGDAAATDASYDLNTLLLKNTSAAQYDIVGGKKSKKSKSKKSKSKKSKSKKSISKKSKSKKSISKKSISKKSISKKSKSKKSISKKKV